MWLCSIAGIDINKMSYFKEHINNQIEEYPEDTQEEINEELELVMKILGHK